EEECFGVSIIDMGNADRTAQRSAKIVLPVARLGIERRARNRSVIAAITKIGLGNLRVGKIFVPRKRIQFFVAEKFEGRSVIAVISRLGRKAFNAARSMAK